MRKSVAVTSLLVLTLLATAGTPVFSGAPSPGHGQQRASGPGYVPGTPAFAAGTPAFSPGEIIIKLRNTSAATADPGLRIQEADRAAVALSSRVGASAQRLFQETWNERLGSIAARHGLDRYFVLRVDPQQDLWSLIRELKSDQNIESAEPNYLVTPGLMIPNDPGFFQQWPLLNFGFGIDGQSATQGADIHATDAW